MGSLYLSEAKLGSVFLYHTSFLTSSHDGNHGDSDCKESACNAGDLGYLPRSGRSPGEGNGYPFQYSCLENWIDRDSWWESGSPGGLQSMGFAESDMAEWLTHKDFYSYMYHSSHFSPTFRSKQSIIFSGTALRIRDILLLSSFYLQILKNWNKQLISYSLSAYPCAEIMHWIFLSFKWTQVLFAWFIKIIVCFETADWISLPGNLLLRTA